MTAEAAETLREAISNQILDTALKTETFLQEAETHSIDGQSRAELFHWNAVNMSAFQELSALKPHSFDAGLVFSGTASGTLIQGFEQASSYTPKTDPNYVFHDSSRDIIVWFLTQSEPLYIYGYQGCGKSSCIKQLAARLNYPVFEITGHGRLEFADLIGHLTMENGNMTFQYGPLALAMRYGGICFINEIDLTSPEIAAGLNGILDGSPLCIAENGGELIEPHPMFRFAATANTNGAGDETGLFQGTQRQNAAFLDSLLAVNLDISLWSARRKMTAQDLGSMELPPEDLASLGSKRIADPAHLKIFGTLKVRATSYLDKHGVRFMSGWAVPLTNP